MKPLTSPWTAAVDWRVWTFGITVGWIRGFGLVLDVGLGPITIGRLA